MTTKQDDDLAVTRCMLLGCTFRYDDYGHPERTGRRMYHTCVSSNTFVVGYGQSQAEAARDWLRRTNYTNYDARA